MIGASSGFSQLAKNVNPKIVSDHFMIHRQALTSKTPTPVLGDSLENVIKIINF
ncbi:MAG: hypothetical protein MHPSP_003987, partial [Paramarteilia canceri]